MELGKLAPVAGLLPIVVNEPGVLLGELMQHGVVELVLLLTQREPIPAGGDGEPAVAQPADQGAENGRL